MAQIAEYSEQVTEGIVDPYVGGNGILTILDETMQTSSKMEANVKIQDEIDQKEFEADMNANKIETAETNMDTRLNNNDLKCEEKTLEVDKLSSRIVQLAGEIDTLAKLIEDNINEAKVLEVEASRSEDDAQKTYEDFF